jgi:hypothetical protein
MTVRTGLVALDVILVPAAWRESATVVMFGRFHDRARQARFGNGDEG